MPRLAPFRQELAKPAIPGPENITAYWHPDRQGVKLAPESFLKRLKEIDPELSATWDPLKEHWNVWTVKRTVTHKLCPGWLLLFSVGPRNLDERVFARLYSASAIKWGNAKEYFLAVEREMTRDREKASQASFQDTLDIAMESFNHSQIKVAMTGKSNGSKFADYHQ